MLICDVMPIQNKTNKKQKQPTILPLRSLPEILVIFLSLTFVRRFILKEAHYCTFLLIFCHV